MIRRWGPPATDPTDPAWEPSLDGTDLPPAPILDVADNPEVGRLYGPAGHLALIVRARTTVPFGPQPTGAL